MRNSNTEQLAHIYTILMANKDKNFVQRILYPKLYPSKQFEGEESPSTHIMSWGESGNSENKRYFVYPTVIYDHRGGDLHRLSDASAYFHALHTGEFIEFSSAKEADWFSQRYKDIWEK